MNDIAIKRKRQQKFLLVLILLTLAFIWGHSMVPRSISATESGRFVRLLAPLWEMLNMDNDMADHIVRKCAHFLEYAVLGGELCLYILLGIDVKIFAKTSVDRPNRNGNKKDWKTKETADEGLSKNSFGKLFSYPIVQSAITELFIALTDETIQIFSDRGSQVQDVWLDFCGACVGSLVVYGVWRNGVRETDDEFKENELRVGR